jgi:hypothetical protein
MQSVLFQRGTIPRHCHALVRSHHQVASASLPLSQAFRSLQLLSVEQGMHLTAHHRVMASPEEPYFVLTAHRVMASPEEPKGLDLHCTCSSCHSVVFVTFSELIRATVV